MDALLTDVNWLAVGLSGAVSFLVGWLWYSPKMFGVGWAEGVGVTLGGADRMPVAAMVSQLAGTLLMAWVIGVTAPLSMALTVLVVAMVLCLLVAAGHFVQKSRYAIATEAGFIVVMAVIMIGAQVLL